MIIMSNYYEYRDVKVLIAHQLMKMDGWKVYGYSPDESDSMTDYYSPAHWGGVAEKNGYILCVDVYGAREAEEIRKYNYNGFAYDKSITEKIKKLKAMTMDRGASEQEETSAKLMIERLQKKAETATENREKYTVIGMIPGHMAHPSRCNWHIEKDGMIIAKGNGILKYRSISKYFEYSTYVKALNDFRIFTEEEYKKKHIKDLLQHGYYTEGKAEKCANEHYEDMKEVEKLVSGFEKLINKFDTTCGCLVGEGDIEQYEKITVTEYKKEIKVVETTEGFIKEGQCFILKTNFMYGRYKGLVYRIHETEYNGKKSYHAYKLNGKLTKECTGRANQANYWSYYITDDSFLKWIEKGAISWCELKEVKTPYEVEKVVKKANEKATKTGNKETKQKDSTEEINFPDLTFEVAEGTDTRTNERIYLVKVKEKLSREEYTKVNKYIQLKGGYYSKFKHAFLFKENPTSLLNGKITEAEPPVKEPPKAEEKQLNYNIIEDKHTRTGVTIWLVNPDRELNKTEFAKVKQKLATLQGYYSGFKKAFIFKYDPTEKLNTA